MPIFVIHQEAYQCHFQKPILIMRSLRQAFRSCDLQFPALELVEDGNLLIDNCVTETFFLFSFFFSLEGIFLFLQIKLLRHPYVWMHFTQILFLTVMKQRETGMQCLGLCEYFMGKHLGQAEVIRLCIRIFQKLIKYHPQSFGYFA